MKTDSMGLIPSFTVRMEIENVLYLSYLVPEKRLRPAVPEKMSFAATLQGRTLLSLVMFRSSGVRASSFPFLRFQYNQANIRTYVLDPVTGKPAVFFLKSGITSRLVAMLTAILGIPWQSISMQLDVPSGIDPVYGYRAEGEWGGAFSVRLTKDEDQSGDLAPFGNAEAAVDFLTGPSVGFYQLSDSAVVRFEVKHSPIKPSTGRIESISFPMLLRPGLVKEEELRLPHSALIASNGYFSISMPPKRVYIR
jgi:hypothetical protein